MSSDQILNGLVHELWQAIYKTMAGAIHLMVLSSPSQDEARRRISVIRLELAVAEGGLGVLHQAEQSSHRVTVRDDADASEGTCLAEVESLPPIVTTVDDLAKRWTREDGLIVCLGLNCGAPLSASDISEAGACRYCGNAHAVLLAYRQGRTRGKFKGGT